MRKPRVLIFVVTDFARLDGGVLWAANLLDCMSRIQEMEFVIVSSGTEEARTANEDFTRRRGLSHVFVPLRSAPIPVHSGTLVRTPQAPDTLLSLILDKFYFMYERDAQRQGHVDAELLRIIREMRPDAIIVNGRNAAFHVPSVFLLPTPCSFITLDNEVAFHRLYRSQSGPPGDRFIHRIQRAFARHGNWLANLRYRRRINAVYRSVSGIVALTEGDLPRHLPDHTVRAVIPPVLKRSDLQWSYTASRTLMYVGNIYVLKVMHAPNRLAIEWICTRFAPAMRELDDTVKIVIIGATEEQVPASWRCPNVEFLGRADKEELDRRMTTVDLFIAPIANRHGAKLKLAECISHGLPFLATDSAMSGLPYLKGMARIDLDRPDRTAQLALQYLNEPATLIKLSQSILAQAESARSAQQVAWSTFLRRSIESAEPNTPISLAL
jgi:glycosyltransferase involved in cell wall biosynthesis